MKAQVRVVLIAFLVFCLSSFPSLSAAQLTAMAPLKVAEGEWGRFSEQLRIAKEAGVQAISVDVWWGLVQKDSPRQFNWSYYRRVFNVIRNAGLKVSPIMSTHACGGNVGDDVNIPIPQWVWQKRKNGQPIHFVSEGGGLNKDYVSYWATDVVLEDYKSFWREFQNEFRHFAPHFSELSISLGASGELHYPAYHGHDADNPIARWPHRGAFQAYGPLAERDLQQSMRGLYGSIENLNQSWGSSYSSFFDIRVPFFANSAALTEALNGNLGRSQMGKDILDWYHQTLLKHAQMVTGAAHEVFHTRPHSLKLPLSLKVPGIHWEKSGQAELMNGLLSSSEWHDRSTAYSSLISTLKTVKGDYSIYTTAAATPNRPGPHPPFSRAEDLVRRVEQVAADQGVSVKVENALASDLYDANSLSLLERHVSRGNIKGVTLLRVSDVAASPRAQRSCGRMLLSLITN